MVDHLWSFGEVFPHAGLGFFEPALVCGHQSDDQGTESYPGEALLVLECRFSLVFWQEQQPKTE